jgi:hypothetical protein
MLFCYLYRDYCTALKEFIFTRIIIPLPQMRSKNKYLPVVIMLLAFCCTGTGSIIYSQAGGGNTWEFLNLTSSARVASLGGKNISLRDADLGMIFHNPALLDSTMHNHLVLNYVSYFSGINYGNASWSFHHKRLGSFAAGVHYINYGDFIAADPIGHITGSFRASENSVNLSWSVAMDSLFRFGATVKGISSSFEQYSSSGVAIDAGINYYNPGRMLSASFVMKNLGTQLSAWYGGADKEPLPFELQLGLTKQLAHAPFRLSVLYQHLQDFGLNDKPSGVPVPDDRSLYRVISSELARHLVFGVEFIPVQSLSLRTGYNNLRRHELRIKDRASTAGFSWGFGIQVTRFRISYGQARYHLAGSSNHFSVSTNLASFYSSRYAP